MCGFNGIITLSTSKQCVFHEKILLHRGPDAFGCFESNIDDWKFRLEHYRLSIIDLDARSNQPFTDGSDYLVYNGEIYNFIDLRATLELHGVEFQTNSDTEVLFHGLKNFGLEFLKRLDGMYSFAFLESKSKRLLLCRDPVGVKPLYYKLTDTEIIFSSELKGLQPDKVKMADVNIGSLAQYLNHGYIIAPNTPYRGVKKLLPGTVLDVDLSSKALNSEIVTYFKHNLTNDNSSLSELLVNSVESRLISDVPVGLYLSGGIDSGLVAAICSKELGRRDLLTLTIGFDDEHDESNVAAEVAKHLGLRHHIVPFNAKSALDRYWNLFESIDEPFADTSMIPTLELNNVAGNYVKVFLSADGGDELFLGYQKYLTFLKYKKFQTYFNIPIHFENYSLNRIVRLWNIFSEKDQLKRYQRFSKYFDGKTLLSHFSENCQLRLSAEPDRADFLIYQHVLDDKVMRMNDFFTYLPDDIMYKSDRASMLNSVEVREPLLSPNLIRHAFGAYSIGELTDGKDGKLPLRNELKKYLPQEIVSLPKKGFSPPFKDWIYEFAYQDILKMMSPSMLERYKIFNSSLVQTFYVNELLRENKKKNFLQRLWTFYILLKWMEKKVEL